MTNENFQQIFDNLKDEVVKLGLSILKKYKEEVKTDALNVLDELKENLQTWTIQLAEGKLSKEDFEFLVLAQKELIEMHALKQAGVAYIKANEFKNKLLHLITDTIIGII